AGTGGATGGTGGTAGTGGATGGTGGTAGTGGATGGTGGSAGTGGTAGTGGATGGTGGSAGTGGSGGSAGAGGATGGTGGSAGAGGTGGSGGAGGSGGTGGATTATVIINEIESSGGDPDDWVELKNVSGATVDISGWIFKDNKDNDTYVIPNGTMVASGAYYMLEKAAFGFGLGGGATAADGDSARLFMPDGTTLVDSYAWTPHATQTYGRCPDGTGPFVDTVAPTKGTANSCPATADSF
ncbi:MAG TPA: lamin tail domain-containing protein, partial [Polyangia bacterium]